MSTSGGRLKRVFLESSLLITCGKVSTVAVLRNAMFKSPRSMLLLSRESKYDLWGSSSKPQYGSKSHCRMPSASKEEMAKSDAAVSAVSVEGDRLELPSAKAASRTLDSSMERVFGGEIGSVWLERRHCRSCTAFWDVVDVNSGGLPCWWDLLCRKSVSLFCENLRLVRFPC
jgi:hypothetical protein